MPDPYAEFGGSTISSDPYAEFGGSMSAPSPDEAVPALVPSHGPSPEGSVIGRVAQSAFEREAQYVQAQQEGWKRGGFGMDPPQPTWNPNTNQYELPEFGGRLPDLNLMWQALKGGHIATAAGLAVAANFDQFPEWVQNLMANRKLPESFGAAGVDAFNLYQTSRFGKLPPVDLVPASETLVRGAAQTASAARAAIPLATAGAGGAAAGAAGHAIGGPWVAGALAPAGFELGARLGVKLRDILPEVPGTKFGLEANEEILTAPADVKVPMRQYQDAVNAGATPQEARDISYTAYMRAQERAAAATSVARQQAAAARAAAPPAAPVPYTPAPEAAPAPTPAPAPAAAPGPAVPQEAAPEAAAAPAEAPAEAPTTFYHGSKHPSLSEVNTNNPMHYGQTLGTGVYVTESPEAAAMWAGDKGHVYSLNASPKNVLDLDKPLPGAQKEAIISTLDKAGYDTSQLTPEQSANDFFRHFREAAGSQPDGPFYAAKANDALRQSGIDAIRNGPETVLLQDRFPVQRIGGVKYDGKNWNLVPEAAQPQPPAPAPSTLTEQLRASLAQEPTTPEPRAPATGQVQEPPEGHAPFGGQFAGAKPPPTAAPTAPEIEALRQQVNDLIDARVPFEDSPAINHRLKAQVGHQLALGNVDKAQEIFDKNVAAASPDIQMTPEEAQKAAESNQWARGYQAELGGPRLGKKAQAQRFEVETNPDAAKNFRDSVQQFLQQNAPQESPIASALRGEQNKVFKLEDVQAAERAASGKLSSMPLFDPDVYKAAYMRGGYEFERLLRTGSATFDVWSKAMMGAYGDVIKPHLEELWRTISEPTRWPDQVSELVPTSKVRARWAFDPIEERRTPTRAAMEDAPTDEQLADLAQRFTNRDQYPGLGLSKKVLRSPKAILDGASDHILENQQFMHDSAPATAADPNGDLLNRDSSSQWYNGFNRLATNRVLRYGLNDLQAHAGIASLSPRTDWFQNLAGFDRMLSGYYDDAQLPWTRGMSTQATEAGTPRNVLSAIRGKKLEALSDPEEIAWWIRLHDLAEKPQRNVMAYAPDGSELGYVTNKGGGNAKFIWAGNGMDPYVKLVNILQDGSRENISKWLGDGTKIRSFTNNGHSPNYDGGGDLSNVSVTSDTHHVASSLLLPVGGQAPQVVLNFAHSPGNNVTGVGGSYGLYADATRAGAAQAGLLPNQFQSIVWDGGRILMPSEWRTEANYAIIKKIWDEVDRGKLSKDQARQRIFEEAGGWNKPRPKYSDKPQD